MTDYGLINHSVLTGTLLERKPLRFTPAGVPVSEALLEHESVCVEAGKSRQVRCEASVLALGDTARWLDASPLGSLVKVTGFLAARSQRSKTLVLHIQQIEFLEGIKNGSFL